MWFLKTVLILCLGCLTLAEETTDNEFDNLAKDIKIYMDQFLPQLQSRMSDTIDADSIDLSYIIANATKDILLNSKNPNDDEDVKNMITEMKTTEIPQVDFVTKDPTDEEIKKLLAPKATIEDEYTKIIHKKAKKAIDSDSEISNWLQNLENPSSSVDTTKKDDDEYIKSMITEMKTTEIPQVDFVTKDPTDDEIEKILAPSEVIVEKSAEVKSKNTKKVIDNDTETSYLLQNLENSSSSVDTTKKDDRDTETSSFLQFIASQMSTSDTQRKDSDDVNTMVFLKDSVEDFGLYNKESTDAPVSVPLYVMGRVRV